jgi:hypothetical protein
MNNTFAISSDDWEKISTKTKKDPKLREKWSNKNIYIYERNGDITLLDRNSKKTRLQFIDFLSIKKFITINELNTNCADQNDITFTDTFIMDVLCFLILKMCQIEKCLTQHSYTIEDIKNRFFSGLSTFNQKEKMFDPTILHNFLCSISPSCRFSLDNCYILGQLMYMDCMRVILLCGALSKIQHIKKPNKQHLQFFMNMDSYVINF